MRAPIWLIVLASTGCAIDRELPFGAVPDAALPRGEDASRPGAPLPLDAGTSLPDAAPPPADMRPRADALPVPPDGTAAPLDAAPPDAAQPDAAPLDAAPLDAAPPDAAQPDAAPLDAAPLDAAPPDAARPDAAVPAAVPGLPPLGPRDFCRDDLDEPPPPAPGDCRPQLHAAPVPSPLPVDPADPDWESRTFDDQGRLAELEGGPPCADGTPSTTWTFAYDGAGLLVGLDQRVSACPEEGDPPLASEVEYRYDAAGAEVERTTSTWNGFDRMPATETVWRTFDATGRLVADRWEDRDEEGSLTGDGDWSGTFDDAGRLVAWSRSWSPLDWHDGDGGHTESCAYDELDRTVTQTTYEAWRTSFGGALRDRRTRWIYEGDRVGAILHVADDERYDESPAPGGWIDEYQYDDQGRVVRVETCDAEPDLDQDVALLCAQPEDVTSVTRYDYAPDGRPLAVDRTYFPRWPYDDDPWTERHCLVRECRVTCPR